MKASKNQTESLLKATGIYMSAVLNR